MKRNLQLLLVMLIALTTLKASAQTKAKTTKQKYDIAAFLYPSAARCPRCISAPAPPPYGASARTRPFCRARAAAPLPRLIFPCAAVSRRWKNSFEVFKTDFEFDGEKMH